MNFKHRTLRQMICIRRKAQKHLLVLGFTFFIFGAGFLAYQNFLFDLKTKDRVERKVTEIVRLAAQDDSKLAFFCAGESCQTLTTWTPDSIKNIQLETVISGDKAWVTAKVETPSEKIPSLFGKKWVFDFEYAGFGWRLTQVKDKGYIWQSQSRVY